jgi:hypothetical protein
LTTPQQPLGSRQPRDLGLPGWTYIVSPREGTNNNWWIAQGRRADTPAALPLVTQGAETVEEAITGLREQAMMWDDMNGPFQQ